MRPPLTQLAVLHATPSLVTGSVANLDAFCRREFPQLTPGEQLGRIEHTPRQRVFCTNDQILCSLRDSNLRRSDGFSAGIPLS